VTGTIRWFKQKKELGEIEDSENIYIGVMFPFASMEQKRAIVDLVRHLKNDMMKCPECSATISSVSFICYNCGSRPIRRRNIFQKMIVGFFNGKDDFASK